MTEQIKIAILGKIAEIEDVLKNYLGLTNEILTSDIDETLDNITSERQKCISRIDSLMNELDEITTEGCTPEEKRSIDGSIKTGHVSLGLTAELKEIRSAAVKMRSLYLESAEKDKLASKRVDARVKELYAELEDLKNDRKHLDLLSRNNTEAQKGGSFDSHL